MFGGLELVFFVLAFRVTFYLSTFYSVLAIRLGIEKFAGLMWICSSSLRKMIIIVWFWGEIVAVVTSNDDDDGDDDDDAMDN